MSVSDIAKNIFKWAVISLVAALLLNCLCDALKTEFLQKFLEENLILLLVALLAINTATIGIILLRLGEISSEYKVKFPRIISAMKQSVWEQLGLITIGTFCLVLHTSKVIKSTFPNADFYLETAIIAIAIYAIVVVYDTADAAFALNHESDKLIDKSKPPH